MDSDGTAREKQGMERHRHRIALQGIRNVCNVTAKTCEAGSGEAKGKHRCEGYCEGDANSRCARELQSLAKEKHG